MAVGIHDTEIQPGLCHFLSHFNDTTISSTWDALAVGGLARQVSSAGSDAIKTIIGPVREEAVFTHLTTGQTARVYLVRISLPALVTCNLYRHP